LQGEFLLADDPKETKKSGAHDLAGWAGSLRCSVGTGSLAWTHSATLRSDRRVCSIPFRPALLRRVSSARKAVDGPRAAGHTNRHHALRANRLLAFSCTASLGLDTGSV